MEKDKETLRYTENLDQFKKYPGNRDLTESNVQSIYNSLKIANLIKKRPIVVDKQMRVIDGQHRLEAAKRLGIGIYYIFEEPPTTTELIQLHVAQKGWDLKDYMHLFLSEGNENYVRIKTFSEKTHMSLNKAISLICSRTRQSTMDFKNGKIIFSVQDYDFLMALVEKTNRVRRTLVERSLHKFPISGITLTKSLFKFMSYKDINFELFEEKIGQNIDKVHLCGTVDDYVRLWQSIYNVGNAKPVSLAIAAPKAKADENDVSENGMLDRYHSHPAFENLAKR